VFGSGTWSRMTTRGNLVGGGARPAAPATGRVGAFGAATLVCFKVWRGIQSFTLPTKPRCLLGPALPIAWRVARETFGDRTTPGMPPGLLAAYSIPSCTGAGSVSHHTPK